MADGLDVKLEGLPEVAAKMEALGDDARLKGGRLALRKAANLIRDAAKAGAERVDDPATSERIADNIVVRFSSRTFRRTGDVSFRVGVLGGARGHAAASGEVAGAGAGNPGGDTFHWRYLEFGTQHIQAQPFMRPALAQNIQEATNTFAREYDKAIQRAIRRATKRGSA